MTKIASIQTLKDTKQNFKDIENSQDNHKILVIDLTLTQSSFSIINEKKKFLISIL